MGTRENDGRAPETCGWSIGLDNTYDEIYVCCVYVIPCHHVTRCPAELKKDGGALTS